MNTDLIEEFDLLTISEYALRIGKPENTVRTWEQKGKFETVMGEREGRKVKLLKVPKVNTTSQHEPVATHPEPQHESKFETLLNHYVETLRQRDHELSELRARLMEAEIRAARAEEAAKQVSVMQTAIEAQQVALDAAKNERMAMTGLLVKREKQADGKPWWKMWP